MKPKILVLYYTQTGQTQQILESIVAGMGGKADIDAFEIEPEDPFPFPWEATSYFDVLPGSMDHDPVRIKPVPKEILTKDYDLVLLGYQPWFLNPSLPVIAFLQSADAQLLKGKPVVTVIGCRKTWLHAQEKVKEYLLKLNSRLVGNIVLKDHVPDPLSSIAHSRWVLKGKKDPYGLLPGAGVADRHVFAAQRFGMPVYKHLVDNNLIDLQRDLLSLGAVKLSYAMIISEQRSLKHLRLAAKYIRGDGDDEKATRVKRFKNILLACYILWPLFLLLTFMKLLLKSPSLLRDREYFQQLQYIKGKMGDKL